MTHEREDLARHARELLAAEYDLVVVLHEENGHANAALNLRQKAANIRKGVAEIHAVRAITTALNLSLPSPPSPTEAMVEAGAIRAAFKNHRVAPYRERLEHCPDSFELSETGQGYRSPHVEAAYRSFAAGYRACLTAAPPHVDARARAIEEAAKVALAEAERMREEARKCTNWSSAQAERLRAVDTAMNIYDAIRALTLPDGEGGR